VKKCRSYWFLVVFILGTQIEMLGQPGLRITEVMSSGGTSDWFELTNMSDSLINLDGYRMDDGSNTFLNSVLLQGIDSILPWESVVFGEFSFLRFFHIGIYPWCVWVHTLVPASV
jgi:hypothetical protein